MLQIGHAPGASIERLGLGHIGGVDRVASTWMEASWRLQDEDGWRSLYNGPSVGVGVFRVGLSGDLDYGSPVGAYGFFQWPVLDTDRIDVRLQAALGLAAGWRPFDPVTNPDQRAIGTTVTALVRFSPTVALQLTERWALYTGLQGAHYSNGALAHPNGGLTVLAPVLGVEWAPAGPRRLPVAPPPPPPPAGDDGAAPIRSNSSSSGRSWSWRARIFGGVKALRVRTPGQVETRRVTVQGATVSVHRMLGARFRAVFASDLMVDGSGGRRHTVATPTRIDGLSLAEQVSVGASLGLELVVNQIALETVYGNAFWRRDLSEQVGRRYQKIGLTWTPSGGLQASMMVRAGDGVADFLEWGLAIVR